MPSGLGFPLAMASLFTLGWIVIQKAGPRTEAVAEGLGALFLLSALLAVVALLAAFGVLIFLFGVFEAFAKNRIAGANPWGEGATTLEWQLPSPPPYHQWEQLPRIK